MSELAKLQKLLSSATQLQDEIEQLEINLKARKQRMHSLTHSEIPATMQKAGVTDITIDGRNMALSPYASSSTKGADWEHVGRLLAKHGIDGEIFRWKYIIPVSEVDEKRKAKIEKAAGVVAEVDGYVHHQNLRKELSRLQDLGQLPEEIANLFNFKQGVYVKIGDKV